MGQLVALGDHCFDADRVLYVGPAGTGMGSPPDLTRIMVHLNMNEWTSTIEISGDDYSLEDVRERINDHRTPVETNAKQQAFTSPEYRSAIVKLDRVMRDNTIRNVMLTDDESRSVLDVCLQVTPEV